MKNVLCLGLVKTRKLQSQSSALAEPFRYDFYKCMFSISSFNTNEWQLMVCDYSDL